MINWQEGDYPAKIWCFLDLRELPEDVEVEVTEQKWKLDSGVHVIIESAEYIEEEDPMSDIWTLVQLETEEIDEQTGMVTGRKFYLVHVDTIKDPLCAIPNIGAKPACQYLLMKPRVEWADDFVAWLEMPHTNDVIEMLPDPVPEAGEEEHGDDADDS